MDRLNYQHLYYFWTVAKTGSVKAACETLGLAQPTISGQLASFQKAIGAKVFRKEGRKLALTESGWCVFNYADEIFGIGNELNSWLRGKTVEQSRNLTIGVCANVDMQAIARLLSPALDSSEAPRLSCFIGDTERLLLDLRLRTCDLAILPAPTQSAGACFNHHLASLQVSLFAPAAEAKKYRKGFPQSVQRAPMVLPGADTALRQSVETWLHAHGVEPDVRAEIGTSELAKSIAATSNALVFAPSLTHYEMRKRYGFDAIGVVEGVEERVYAVTNQRKIRNAAAARIVAMAPLTTAAGGKPQEALSAADFESGVCV